MRVWAAVDTDQLDDDLYRRVTEFKDAFQHPALPVLLIPGDMLAADSVINRLIDAGVPMSAIRLTEKRT